MIEVLNVENLKKTFKLSSKQQKLNKTKIKNRIIFHPVLAFLNILMGFHLIDL